MQEALSRVKPASQAEIIKILAGVSVFKRIPNAQTQEQVNFFLKVYAERLKNFSLETIQKAANSIIDSNKSDWFPQPAEMIEICQEYHKWYTDDVEKIKNPLLDSSWTEERPKHSGPEELFQVSDHVAETIRKLNSSQF